MTLLCLCTTGNIKMRRNVFLTKHNGDLKASIMPTGDINGAKLDQLRLSSKVQFFAVEKGKLVVNL